MAGIQEAMKRVMEHRNEGTVMAEGYLRECNCLPGDECHKCKKTRYIIIRLKPEKREKEGALITQYDYGSDVQIASNVETGHKVILLIQSNWRAVWMRCDDQEVSRDMKANDIIESLAGEKS